MEEQMRNPNQENQSGFQQKGDVYVKPPKKTSTSKKSTDGGEYVDFEEVE